MIRKNAHLCALVLFATVAAFRVPAAHAQCLSCPGDMNEDGALDGSDIQLFVDCLLGGEDPVGECGCADMNADAMLTEEGDVATFAAVILAGESSCAFISLGFGLVIVPGQTAGLPVSLSLPAPPGGVTVNFVSDDPDIATIEESVFIPEGDQTPAANPQVTGVSIGTAIITASAEGFAQDTREVIVAPNSITLSPDPLNVGEGQTVNITLSLEVEAPAGGLFVTLSTDDPSIATAPADVTVPEGINSIPVPVTGVASGTTILRANATDIPEETATINVSLAAINLDTPVPIGDDLQTSYSGSLTTAAPPGNLDVTITSIDPDSLLVATGPAMAGSESIVVTVPAGSTIIPTFYVQALADTGTADLTASAPGYNSDTATFDLDPSGFIIWTPGDFTTTTLSPPTTIQIRPARLSPDTLAYSANQTMRGGITPVEVEVTSSDTAVGVMTTSPLTFNGGDYFANTTFDPLAAGTSDIDVPPPSGFDTPSNFTQITATVIFQDKVIILTGTSIGDDLEADRSGSLTVPAPPGNLDVTITSDDTDLLLLSNAPDEAGSASIVVTVPAGSTTLPTFYVHALSDSGSAGITASAPDYADGTATFDLDPSGFIIWTPGNFTTTTFSPPTTIQIRPVRLDPDTLNYAGNQRLRGGITPVDVDVTSSNTAVGVITISPLTLSGGDYFANTAFDPLDAGMSDIDSVTPPDFDTPANYTQITATVEAPDIIVADSVVGEDLQLPQPIYLEAAPPAPVDVTVTIDDSSIALVSDDPLAAGGASVTFSGVTTTFVGYVYVQGLLEGDTSMMVQAEGYNDAIADVDVNPSGFIIWTPGDFTTSTFSPPTTIQIRPVRLDPNTLNYASTQALRGGITPVDVEVASSDPDVGVITISPLTFNGNDYFANTAFDPLIAGTADIDVGTPPGFDTPANYIQITATVTAPDIFIGDSIVGEDLQVTQFIYLAVAPPNPVDVVVTINNPTLAVISDDPLAAGGASVTFSDVTTTFVGYLYVQGLLEGNTTITVQAPGYNDATADVDVDPSGFIIWTPGDFTTTLYSPPTTVQIRPARLDPNTLNYAGAQPLRGGITPVEVEVTSSDTDVGVITISPLTFNGNDYFANTGFDPLDLGMSDINVLTPAGFDMSSNLTEITATVTIPDISLPDTVVGEDLQVVQSIYLETAPPAPVDVTVTVNDPTLAIVSDDPLSEGSDSITFFDVSTTFVGYIYVQGLLEGNTTITVQAEGYNDAVADVDVDPSGFIIWTPGDFTTTVSSPPTTVQIRPARLDPNTLNYTTNQPLRGGITPVEVQVTSSDTNVGVITISPLTFNGNDYFANTAFDPLNVGMSDIDVLTPAGWDMSSNFTQITATVNP